MNFSYLKSLLRFMCAIVVFQLMLTSSTFGAPQQTLRVAVAGTAPFVVNNEKVTQGIAAEIWRDVAAQNGWKYQMEKYPSVPDALTALRNHQVDVVVGPTSISSSRAQFFEFTQPYFQSSLSILAPLEEPTFLQRMSPFFSKTFFAALGILILFLFIVGTLFWLVEHRHENSDFPEKAVPGIASGMWCAIVTMTTVGYGDISPKTGAGRFIAATWMIISVVAATSLVAGIASTLSASNTGIHTIRTAEDLHERTIGVLAGSPAESFVEYYNAKIEPITSLKQGYEMLKKKQVDAVVFDRPQLLYFLQQRHDPRVKVLSTQYQPQGYGFAFPLGSPLAHQADVRLLQLKEGGRVKQIVEIWLGKDVE